MSLKHGLLGLLNYEPLTGYDLNKFFKESVGHFWHAKASQIYRELDAMEKTGWLTSERIIQEEKPNKRVYSITDKGKAELVDWLLAYDPFKNMIAPKNAFMMRIFFGGEIDKNKTVELLRTAREKLLEYVQEMENIMETVEHEEIDVDSERKKYWKITIMSGVIMNKSQIEWIDKSIALLEEENEENKAIEKVEDAKEPKDNI